MFTLLRRAVDDRSRRFAEQGVSTLAEYAQAVGSEAAPPRIMLLLDSYAGFTAAFERVDLGALVDALARIVSDGRAAGVHVVATADRRNAVPQAVASLIARKLVLRQADEDEYGTLGLDRRATRGAELPPGRGFAEGSLEIQTPLVGDDPAGERVAAAIAAEAAALRARHGDNRAPQLLPMPEHHPRSALPPATDATCPYLGIEETDLAPVFVDLRDAHFLVTGPHRTGRTTALQTIVESALEAPEAPELHLLAPRRSALADSDVWETCARGQDACVAAAGVLLELAYDRSPDERHPPLFVVVDDAHELSESVAASSLEDLARRGRDVNVRIVAACENASARGYNPWIGELRKDGNGLLLCPNIDLDGDLLGVRLPRRSPRTPVPGRGYLVRSGQAALVQVAEDAPLPQAA